VRQSESRAQYSRALPGKKRSRTALRRRRVAAVLVLAAGASLEARAESGVTPESEEDARILVETAIAVARATLAEEGDFHPFAFFVGSDGRVQRVTPKRDAALPAPEEVLGMLEAAFRERAAAGECRAVALVADVRIALPGGGESDALHVAVEHRSGYCQNFFHPFERASDGGIRFGEPI
jgi:hypothetical protein